MSWIGSGSSLGNSNRNRTGGLNGIAVRAQLNLPGIAM